MGGVCGFAIYVWVLPEAQMYGISESGIGRINKQPILV
jgi:hypothetical protein